MKSELIVEEIIKEFFRENDFPWPEKAVVEPPKDKKFGDVASNAALVGGKAAGMNPRELAEKIQTFCLEREARLQDVQIAGPGFLNFTFKNDFWKEVVPNVLLQGGDFGRSEYGRGKK